MATQVERQRPSLDHVEKTRTLICALNLLSRDLPLPPDVLASVSSIYHGSTSNDDVDDSVTDSPGADGDSLLSRNSVGVESAFASSKDGSGVSSYGDLIMEFEDAVLNRRQQCVSGARLTQLKDDRLQSRINCRLSELEACRGGLVNGSLVTKLAYESVCNNPVCQQQRTFIQMRTKLTVVDNSGAKEVMCIQALKGKKGARLGDIIVAFVKEARPGGKVKKGDVVWAAIQRGRCDGSEVKFDDSTALFLNNQGEPVGTRVSGPVPHELRKKKQLKILTMDEHLA